MSIHRQLGLALTLAAAATLAVAQAPAAPAAPALSPQQRTEVLQALSTKLRANYVFPDVAAGIVAALPARAQAYASAVSATELVDMLSKDLRNLGNDKHFRVFYDPRFHEDDSANSIPTAQHMERQRAEAASLGFGIEKLQRLPGNVALLELRGFGPPELVGAAYAAAVTLLDGSDALILDLRRNGGGSPDSVALWMSHFFPQGDQRHLNDIYTRSTDKTQQYWTLPSVTPRYAKPVYVLTSARTFSGGEECAYDFQTQKRAVLVGQTTGGGANAGDRFSLGHGIVVNIPTARAINPITHTNWEHVGVKPDIEAPAAQAQQVAYVAILRMLSSQAEGPEKAERLRKWLALAEKGESEPPVFEMKL
jgi:Peptidase family S41/N-terminal domain of Peptidase_S41 in eukaryotic IRBP